MAESISGAADVIQKFNVRNAKILAFVVLIGFVFYHAVLHLTYGIDSCKWLLSEGRFQGYQVWQPYGCMMHTYSEIDTRNCLRYIAYFGNRNHLVFMGDSRIRSLYHVMADQVSLQDVRQDTKLEEKLQEKVHSDLSYSDPKLSLQVEFKWAPTLNSSMDRLLDTWIKHERPKVLVVGSATWIIKAFNGSIQGLEEYNTNLTRLTKKLDLLAHKGTRILWMLQEPVMEERLVAARAAITNEQIELYNKAAMQVLKHSNVDIWSSARLVTQGDITALKDGLHVEGVPLKYQVQVLLNMYCNDHLNFNDGTCCSSGESITTLQKLFFGLLGCCLVCSVCLYLYGWCCRKKPTSREMMQPLQRTGVKPEPPSDFFIFMRALAKLAVILSYFFLCDRTNFFMKENKYFTRLNFWLPFGYVFTLGLFFTEDSKYTSLLHRDQTDEWKGWMQLVILIYHMTGASTVLPIYMHIRLLVTAYLFLTGYGHFCHFWAKGDAGFIRFFQVMFRMNFLTVVLCLSMNRPYQFYYFVPLVSFWYLVVYLVLVIPPQVTAASTEHNSLHYLYLVLKFVVVFSIVTIMYMSEVFFEKIFVTRPWKALFVTTDDDIHEWWFRWKLDRYSVLIGMVFAFAYQLAQRYCIIDDNNHNNLVSGGIALTATLLSLLGIGAYTSFAFLCKNKPECNEVHSYIGFIPVVSYIVLRNVSGVLRTRYSNFFAWLGQISLELFIGQYHVWLAADTHGVHVLLPSYPVANVILTSFIFVCIAHEINVIKGVLTPWAVPDDWKKLLRNLLIFVGLLIPIGIHDGMF